MREWLVVVPEIPGGESTCPQKTYKTRLIWHSPLITSFPSTTTIYLARANRPLPPPLPILGRRDVRRHD